MSEACHCCGGDVLQARVACLGVLTEMGLNIRIEASHHPSSSLAHPAWQAERFKPQMGESRKTGGYSTAAVPPPPPQIWDLEEANLILMGVFLWQGFVTLVFLIMEEGLSQVLILPHSSPISTKPPTSSVAVSLCFLPPPLIGLW